MVKQFYLVLVGVVFSVVFSVCVFGEYAVENAFPDLEFEDPVGIYHAGDGSNRLFVVEQQGCR